MDSNNSRYSSTSESFVHLIFSPECLFAKAAGKFLETFVDLQMSLEAVGGQETFSANLKSNLF
jgi:hypothetical protein